MYVIRSIILVAVMGACGGDGGPGPVGPPTTNPPPAGGTPVAAATVQAGATTNDFTPARVDLTRNGTVTWTFGALTHNVTFGSSGAPANIGDTSGQTVSRTFPNAGTFNYACTLHAGMSGTVVVQ
jgi:plastocyanin